MESARSRSMHRRSRTRRRFVAAILVTLSYVALDSSTRAQMPGMGMPRATLFVAQLDAAQVVGGSNSQATGTGAFLLDLSSRAITYTVTYQGLHADRTGSIGLYNFG